MNTTHYNIDARKNVNEFVSIDLILTYLHRLEFNELKEKIWKGVIINTENI